MRLPSHRVSTAGSADADRLVAAVTDAEATPPSIRELMSAGFDQELIRAVCAEGRLVRISADLVMTPSIVDRAAAFIRDAGPAGERCRTCEKRWAPAGSTRFRSSSTSTRKA